MVWFNPFVKIIISMVMISKFNLNNNIYLVKSILRSTCYRYCHRLSMILWWLNWADEIQLTIVCVPLYTCTVNIQILIHKYAYTNIFNRTKWTNGQTNGHLHCFHFFLFFYMRKRDNSIKSKTMLQVMFTFFLFQKLFIRMDSEINFKIICLKKYFRQAS